MVKICFVCLGNICRSPMAEFIMKKKLNDLNLKDYIHVVSRATSYEEEGSDIYPPAKEMLIKKNVPYTSHRATVLQSSDYHKFDYFIAMDKNNIRNMNCIFNGDPENKIYRLLDFTELNKDIEDPWYTRDFQKAYEEINYGCESFLSIIKNNSSL